MRSHRIIIITILLCFIIYIKSISRENAFFLDIVNLATLATVICLLPIKFTIKIALFAVLLLVFRINLAFYLYLAQVPFRPKSNQIFQKEVTSLFQSKFNFIHNFSALPPFPTMLVTNYIYDRFEHLACIVIPHEIAIVMGKAMVKLAKLDKVVDHFILRSTEGGSFDDVKQQVQTKFNQGLSIFTYVTKISPGRGHVSRVRSGMFTIAKDLGIPITPVAIDYVHFNPLGAIVPQNFQIHIGETFRVDDIQTAVRKTRTFLKQQHQYFIQTKFTTTSTNQKHTK